VEALRRTEVGRAELPGELYMYVMVGVTALCITLLVRRYQRIEA
jgi:hypothetical protein